MDITEGSMSVNENTELGVDDYDRATEAQKAASVKVVRSCRSGCRYA